MRAYGLTSPGLLRSNNEDAFLCDLERRLFVVADGMGGHAAGEVASRLAIESITQFFGQADTIAFGGPQTGPSTAADADRVQEAIAAANRRVFRAASEEDAYAGMGTTMSRPASPMPATVRCLRTWATAASICSPTAS